MTTCPTGIDIRDGLQMECVNCTQCIDACDLVMEKVGRAPNLIRYSSQSRDRGEGLGLWRARMALYPLMLLRIVAAFFAVFLSSKTFDAVVLREPGNPFMITEDGHVRNMMRIKLTNRTEQAMTFQQSVRSPEGVRLELQEADFEVPAIGTRSFHVSAIAPMSIFSHGRAELELEIENDAGVSRTMRFKLVGP